MHLPHIQAGGGQGLESQNPPDGVPQGRKSVSGNDVLKEWGNETTTDDQLDAGGGNG